MMTVRSLESVHSPRYFRFCYYIYGQSGPSLLIESTDSMIYGGVANGRLSDSFRNGMFS